MQVTWESIKTLAFYVCIDIHIFVRHCRFSNIISEAHLYFMCAAWQTDQKYVFVSLFESNRPLQSTLWLQASYCLENCLWNKHFIFWQCCFITFVYQGKNLKVSTDLPLCFNPVSKLGRTVCSSIFQQGDQNRPAGSSGLVLDLGTPVNTEMHTQNEVTRTLYLNND